MKDIPASEAFHALFLEWTSGSYHSKHREMSSVSEIQTELLLAGQTDAIMQMD